MGFSEKQAANSITNNGDFLDETADISISETSGVSFYFRTLTGNISVGAGMIAYIRADFVDGDITIAATGTLYAHIARCSGTITNNGSVVGILAPNNANGGIGLG